MSLRVLFAWMLCLLLQDEPVTGIREASVTIRAEGSFYVAGYSIRTNNSADAGGPGRIGKLWQRFTELKIADTIPDRVDRALVVVYSEYSHNANGDYSYLLGARTSSIEHLPAGMTYLQVAGGPYAVFITSEGPLVEVLRAEWRRIWAIHPGELGGERAFATDYEIYDERSADPKRAQIEIHIGLRSPPESPVDPRLW
jgi:predicted transcriptional regulator YdeE